ncbi:class I SAM-dependent methyltransferase [Mycobacterium sp.]|jgi:methyltransferase (TIGR00027 family)|uniref:class I SAM-dependent methyltransferase n=1 Tax=Mycobacterium sp. TaxID=1785 RepID=UPI002CD5D82F|nr:class I SAM-dependent methyltransferase [Mycobacterium sp.]HTH90240.1 class I SAM-dependent methyltransferase [Mycobacterium sp.]
MSRTDTDSWDLASSVGATATMVAAARALVSREPDALIDDPFAAPLVRAVGLDFFTRLVDGDIPLANLEGDGPRFMANWIAVRTRFFDDFFVNAGAVGIRQAVILAAGLDSRAYRLPWAAGTTVFELDQPKVIEFKTTTMTAIGATPKADRRTVSVDLREDWPAALRHSGFDESQPTAWSAEGLLAYLPPEAQDRLFDNITALSMPGSQLATEYHLDGGAAMGERGKAMGDHWRAHGFDVDLSELFYPGERSHVVEYLSGHGWTVSARNRPEVFADYGRAYPNIEALSPMRNSLAVIATRK